MKAEKDLLEKIKNMSKEELDVLCEDIRKTIIDTVSRNGGHLASNLGIVEATVSLYRNFDFPKDSLIFDVGHQSYPHKILSGRGEEFETLRKFGGISGFTDRFESEFDKVNAGHCGPSVSAAIGVATANKLSNSDSYTVCVVGDGSFTNGMIYEALNNCLDKSLKLIIVLNDNEMSISKNVGAMSDYFSKIRTSKRYFSLKHFFYSAFSAIPLVGKHLVGFARGFKDFLKRVVVKSNFFEDFGIDYLGPVDGNDIKKLDIVFKEAKAKNSICLVHICTKKGKGYPYSQESPEQYHSVGTFDVSCGSAPSIITESLPLALMKSSSAISL